MSTVTNTNPMGQDNPTDPRQCRATSRSGNQCGNRAINGGTVCHYHGGAAPQVKHKARMRLLELVDPAVAQLARVLTTADKDSDKLRAIENILDRTGHGRSTTVEVEDTRAMILDQIAEMKAKRDEIEMIEDAEIIDDNNEETP